MGDDPPRLIVYRSLFLPPQSRSLASAEAPALPVGLFPLPEFLNRIEPDNLLSARPFGPHSAGQSSKLFGDAETFGGSAPEVPFQLCEAGGLERV